MSRISVVPRSKRRVVRLCRIVMSMPGLLAQPPCEWFDLCRCGAPAWPVFDGMF